MASIADESVDFFSVEEDGQSNHEQSARQRFLKSSSTTSSNPTSPTHVSFSTSEGSGAINEESQRLIRKSPGSRGHVPLTIFLCLVGLHNPHRYGRSLWSAILIFLFSVAVLIQILINVACIVKESEHCLKVGHNTTNLHPNEKTLLFVSTVFQYLCPLATYSVTLWCVHRALRTADALHPSLTRILASRDNWKKINVRLIVNLMVLVLWFVVSSVMIYKVDRENSQSGLGALLIFVHCFKLVMLFVGLLANHAIILMFQGLVFALSGCVDQMKQHVIEHRHQNVNEAIVVFKDLSKVVRATSKVFGPWFLIQWSSYALIIVWNSPLIQADLSLPLYPIWTKTSLSVLSIINHMLFILPAVTAASLDGRCKEMVTELNDLVSSDFPAGNILKDRSQLELFLSHADRSDLAFRIGPFPIRMLQAVASVAFSFVVASVNIAWQNY